MLTQAFSKAFIVLDYEANKEFISKFLCINRQKPKLKCHGKCVLLKNLKKAEQTENPAQSKDQKQKQDITLYYQPLAATVMLPAAAELQLNNSAFEGRPVGVHLAIFHPPQTVA